MHVVLAERKTFSVDAVRVTASNIEEVAAWCGGDVRSVAGGREGSVRPYIKVRVLRPLDDKQTMAFIGDWVLHAGTGYKVYGDSAFHKSFTIITDLLKGTGDGEGSGRRAGDSSPGSQEV